MADAFVKGMSAVARADLWLAALRSANALEVKRTVALMQAEAIEEQAKQIGDQMLDGDVIAVVEERARLYREKDACLEEARRAENEIRSILWDLQPEVA